MIFLTFKFLKLAFRALIAVLVGAGIYLVVTVVQVLIASRAPSSPSSVATAHAAVVLVNTAKGAQLTRELGDAATLLIDNRVRTVVLAGPKGATASADRYLHEHLKNETVQTATTTGAQPFVAVASKVGADHSVIVVTDPYRALWARGAAGAAGLKPQVLAVSESKQGFGGAVDEVCAQAAAVAISRMIGYGHLGWLSG